MAVHIPPSISDAVALISGEIARCLNQTPRISDDGERSWVDLDSPTALLRLTVEPNGQITVNFERRKRLPVCHVDKCAMPDECMGSFCRLSF